MLINYSNMMGKSSATLVNVLSAKRRGYVADTEQFASFIKKKVVSMEDHYEKPAVISFHTKI